MEIIKKGSGWEAWADCEKRDVELKLASADELKDVRLTCGGPAFATVNIKMPAVLACGDTIKYPHDSIIVTITNEAGIVGLKDTLSSAGSVTDANKVIVKELTKTFGIGTYRVTFDLLADSDPSKQLAQIFAVVEPSMTCNDEVNTVFGAACQLVITPDMVLEDSCSNLFKDSIIIKFGNIVLATGTKENLPVVTKDTIIGAGAPICDGELTIQIHRTYPAAGTCNNGDYIQTCETILKYTDNSDPIFVGHSPARLDTIVAINGDSLVAIMAAAKPGAQDNCGTPTVTPVATDLAGNALDFSNICSAPWTVLITYTAEDACKNTATETDTLVILRPTEFSQVVDSSPECSDAAPDYLTGAPQLQIGTWKNGQLADTTGTLSVDTLVYTAGFILRYTDQVIDANACDKKIFRTWYYDDWCTPGSGPQPAGVQFINIQDRVAPYFTYEGADTLESTPTTLPLDRGACTKSVTLADLGGSTFC